MTPISPARHIDYVPLDQVTETEGNPKGHDIPSVIRSISVLGFTAPAVVDERTDRLIIGHGRLAALRVIRDYLATGEIPDRYADAFDARTTAALESGAPDGIRVDDDGVWHAPIVRGWTSLDDDHARAAVIADNKLTERGGWHDQTLVEWLDELADTDPGLLEVTSFTAGDLDSLLVNLGVYAGRTSNMFDNPAASKASLGDEDDDDSDDDGEGESGGGDSNELGPSTSEFVQVSWVVTAEQRKTIRKALSRAQKTAGAANSTMALVAVAEHFLAAHPDPDEKK